jgi:succinate-semialdehyde dehydrogenase / glutarate-semialdehyde dehydrogenase
MNISPGHLSSRVFDVLNPADGMVVGSVPDMDASAVSAAVSRAEQAQVAWREVPPIQRCRLLRDFSARILADADRLSNIIHREQGKSVAQGLAEVNYGAGFVDWYAEEGRRVYGDVIQANLPHQRIFVNRCPIGVCAAITPWNYPLAMVTRKIAPALAAGCTVVLKPAERTPLTAYALLELALEAGLPEGVFNVVTALDPDPIGEVFANSEIVRHLSFTGSVPVGKKLLAMAGSTVKRCTMELGGNAPFIVMADADIHAAIDGLMASKFRNSGQTCVCPNRVLVQRSVYDMFVTELSERVSSLRVAPAPNFDVGPLISSIAVERVRKLIAEATAAGAATILAEPDKKDVRIVHPVIIGEVGDEMEIWNSEVFAPVISICAFEDDEEAIRISNKTSYGLAAYLYSTNLSQAIKISEKLEYGMIGINDVSLSQDIIPFGGTKQSGIGYESSRYGIEEYLEIKTMCISVN